jgi:hypothetical protein
MVSPWKIRKYFPKLEKIHSHWGTMLHEGQFNDTRQCIMTLLTSSIDKYSPGFKGTNIANYVKLQGFKKDADGKITGAMV